MRSCRNFSGAFTLAEVLITLGIIGVVAALTMPTLIANHKKHVVETKLKRFYTNINQAIKLSEVENGPAEYWVIGENHSAESIQEFYNCYLKKYLKTISSDIIHNEVMDNDKENVLYEQNLLVVKFTDGTAMSFSINGKFEVSFYTDANKINSPKSGKDTFSFVLNKNTVEPYANGWDGTKEYLISHPRYGCSNEAYDQMYCAKLIQLNGWKIPEDYPLKF